MNMHFWTVNRIFHRSVGIGGWNTNMEKLAVRYRTLRKKADIEEEELAINDLRRNMLYEHIEKIIAYAEVMLDTGSDSEQGWEDI